MVTIGLLYFILATYSIGDKQNVWKTSHLETVFNVNGLQIGNNVRYSV
jgi:hypothetical protein